MLPFPSSYSWWPLSSSSSFTGKFITGLWEGPLLIWYSPFLLLLLVNLSKSLDPPFWRQLCLPLLLSYSRAFSSSASFHIFCRPQPYSALGVFPISISKYQTALPTTVPASTPMSPQVHLVAYMHFNLQLKLNLSLWFRIKNMCALT